MKPQAPTAVRSTLTAKSLPGQRDRLLAVFFQRRVLQECQAAVPGFLSAEVLVSMADADEVQISVLWRDEGAWRAWQESPVRLEQAQDLAPFLAGAPQGQLYRLARNPADAGQGDTDALQ